MKIFSPEFQSGNPIPSKYTCDGLDISFPLNWEKIPDGTKSLAIIMDDPDAPGMTWVHWVIYNIPPTQDGLPENVTREEILPDGSLNGRNSWKRIGYGGPCPPSGTHRYYSKLYALDYMLDQKAGLSKGELLDAMEGHILEETQMYGTYRRK